LGRIGPDRFGLIWICIADFTADFLQWEKHDISVKKRRSETPDRWVKTRAPMEKKKRSRNILEIIAASNFVMQREDLFSC